MHTWVLVILKALVELPNRLIRIFPIDRRPWLLGMAGFVSESMDCIWSILAFLSVSTLSVEVFLSSLGSWLPSCAFEEDDADDEGRHAVDAPTLFFVVEGSDGASSSISWQRMMSGLRMPFDE